MSMPCWWARSSCMMTDMLSGYSMAMAGPWEPTVPHTPPPRDKGDVAIAGGSVAVATPLQQRRVLTFAQRVDASPTKSLHRRSWYGQVGW